MSFNLSSRFSDSTIASASTSFSMLSSASSASSVEESLLPAFSSYPKPPPRTSSITLKSTKTYTDRRERKKPAPLQLVTSNNSPLLSSSDEDADDDVYFSCNENVRNCRSSYKPKCFCGSPVRSSASCSSEIYCSTGCARQDALYALEGRSPSCPDSSGLYSDNDEEDSNFPVTPTNAFVPSPPRTPAAERPMQPRCPPLAKKVNGLGASHYRRMEAAGLYDIDTTPTRPSVSYGLLEPIDLMVAHSPSSKTAQLRSSLAESDEEDELDFNPRKTLFFQVPIYMGSSPVQS